MDDARVGDRPCGVPVRALGPGRGACRISGRKMDDTTASGQTTGPGDPDHSRSSAPTADSSLPSESCRSGRARGPRRPGSRSRSSAPGCVGHRRRRDELSDRRAIVGSASWTGSCGTDGSAGSRTSAPMNPSGSVGGGTSSAMRRAIVGSVVGVSGEDSRWAGRSPTPSDCAAGAGRTSRASARRGSCRRRPSGTETRQHPRIVLPFEGVAGPTVSTRGWRRRTGTTVPGRMGEASGGRGCRRWDPVTRQARGRGCPRRSRGKGA